MKSLLALIALVVIVGCSKNPVNPSEPVKNEIKNPVLFSDTITVLYGDTIYFPTERPVAINGNVVSNPWEVIFSKESVVKVSCDEWVKFYSLKFRLPPLPS